MTKQHRKHSFTLLELLTVCAVIAVLVAMLLPALSRAKFQARMVICVSQLKQIGMGQLSYTGDYDTYYCSNGRMIDWGTWVRQDAYKHLADYLGYPEHSIKAVQGKHNPLFQCPQGMSNRNGKTAEFYAMFPNNFRVASQRHKPNGYWEPIYPKRVMRKAGQGFNAALSKEWSKPEPPDDRVYHILASDATHGAYGGETNHIWRGMVNATNGYGVLKTIGSPGSKLASNYVFDDGSVQSYSNFYFKNWRSTMYMIEHTFGYADWSQDLFPKEFSEQLR